MDTPYSQPTATPTPKVASVGIAGAATILLVFLAQAILKVEITAEVASAITALIAFGAGYIKKDVKPATAAKIIESSRG